MGDVVNLRRARKAKARSGAAARTAENRVRFGRTRAERQADAANADRLARALDGAERRTGGTADEA